MQDKNKDINNIEDVNKTNKNRGQFSVFQVVIFSFLFVIMIWIIGFLTVELNDQKQQLLLLNKKVDQIENGGADLLRSYVDKIKELQKIDVKEQVENFGSGIKENIQQIKSLMFDKADLLRIEDKIKRLEDYNKEFRGFRLLRLVSIIVFRDAVNRGAGFKEELITLLNIFGNEKEVLIMKQILEASQNTGIKTKEQLKKDFIEMADSLVFKLKYSKYDNGIKGKFLNRILGLVKIRKISFDDESVKDMNNIDTIVAKVEWKLMQGDLKTAVELFENLKEINFDKARAWYYNASLRVLADELINSLFNSELKNTVYNIKNIK